MSFLLNALLYLLFASLTPEASAVIVVVHHTGLSDTTRIIIIVVCVVIFILLLACRFARMRQNRKAALAAAPIIPVNVTQVPNGTYGPGGYNNYPVPPPVQGQYPPPQGYPQNYAPQPAYGQPPQDYPRSYEPQPGFQQQPSEKDVGALPVTDSNGNPQVYSPPAGPPPQGGGFYPPPGPPPSGYDATPLASIPAAHTTGQDHSGFRPQ